MTAVAGEDLDIEITFAYFTMLEHGRRVSLEVFSDTLMELTGGAANIGLRAFRTSHLIYTHFGVAKLGFVDGAVADFALFGEFLPVEKGSEITILTVNSYRELGCSEHFL